MYMHCNLDDKIQSLQKLHFKHFSSYSWIRQELWCLPLHYW